MRGLSVLPTLAQARPWNLQQDVYKRQGMHADKILTSGTQMFIVTMGGTGATLVVPFMFIDVYKRQTHYTSSL